MKTFDVSCPPRGLVLGYAGENIARGQTFDFTAWAEEYGAGSLQVALQRPGDAAPYPVALTVEGTVATWLPTETDLQEAGTGQLQLIYTVGEVRVKTLIVSVLIGPSLGSSGEVPAPGQAWIDQLTDLAAVTEQNAASAAESAENAETSAEDAQQYAEDAGDAKAAAVAAAEAAAASVSHYPQIVGGVWYVWSPTAGEYISTGIDAQGEDGVSPTVEITAIQGGHRVVITDAEGPHAFDVLDGVTPDLSAYRTAADQDVIDEELDDQIADLKSAINAKADIDGDYEYLTAGNAYELLSDRGDTNQQPYLFRQTGGDSSAYNREQLKKIVGGTVAWNQLLSESTISPYATTIKTITPQKVVLVPDGNYSTTLHYGASLTGRALDAIPLNHVLFVCVDCTSTQADKFRARIGNSMFWSASVSANTTTHINAIGRLVSSVLTVYAYDDTLYSTTDEITFQNWNIFDLTQMFGTAVADYIYSLEQATAGAGVAFFRKLFPDDYYDYNPGELMSVEGVSAHETEGFNLFDADDVLIPLGFVKQNDGSLYLPTASTITPGTIIWDNTLQTDGQIYLSYEYKNSSGSSGGARFKFVYADGTQVSMYPLNTTAYTKFSAVSTQGKKVKSIKYDFGSGSIATWLKDFCINLSDPKRNGTYEPYKKRTYPLDSSLTLRGVPKLDSNNRLYYDGDTYEPDGTVTRRFKEIVLDGVNQRFTSAWGSVTNGYAVYKTIDDIADYGRPLILADKFTNFFGGYNYMPIWSVGGNNGALTTVTFLFPSTITSTAEANNWLKTNNVTMIYPVATPTTETAEPYRELEICDRDGTEEFVSTSIVPVGHETFYPVNVFDYIDRLTEPDADMIADSAIAANKYFSVGNRLFLSTASIAAGAQIIPGTNCTETSLAAALNALNA